MVAVANACQAIEPVLRAEAGEDVAREAARALQRIIPGQPAYACLLENAPWENAPWIGVCDSTGAEEPRGAKALRDRLLQARAGAAAWIPPARADKLPGKALAVQPIEMDGRRFGLLAVASSTADDPDLRRALEVCACPLALVLALRAERADHAAAREQLADETQRGDIGEMVGPALHEIGNFINTVFLTFAVLEAKLPVEVRGDFSGVRKQGRALAALSAQVQQARRGNQGSAAFDLHAALREAVAELNASPDQGAIAPDAAPGAQIDLALAPGELVVDRRGDVKRLCRFLTANSAAAAPAGGKVILSTQRAHGAVLRIEVRGKSLDENQLQHFWEPGDCLAPLGMSGIMLATCWSLVKRLGGGLEVANLEQGSADGSAGFAITVRLPLASIR